jgi:hypothetical protein
LAFRWYNKSISRDKAEKLLLDTVSTCILTKKKLYSFQPYYGYAGVVPLSCVGLTMAFMSEDRYSEDYQG